LQADPHIRDIDGAVAQCGENQSGSKWLRQFVTTLDGLVCQEGQAVTPFGYCLFHDHVGFVDGNVGGPGGGKSGTQRQGKEQGMRDARQGGGP